MSATAGIDLVRRREARAEELIGLGFGDVEIANRTRLPRTVINRLRLLRVGAVPNVSHTETIRYLFGLALRLGFWAKQEPSYRDGSGKRLVPDLLVYEVDWDDPALTIGEPLLTIEVKSELRTRGAADQAVEQVIGYRDLVGGLPIVTSYRVAPIAIDAGLGRGVYVLPLSGLCAVMKKIAREAAS